MGDWNMNEVIMALQGTYGVETPAFDRAWGFFKSADPSKQVDYMSNLGVTPTAKVGAQAVGGVATPDNPSATADAEDDGTSNETMGAVMGAMQALTGLGGQHQAYKAQKRALKLKQSEIKINKIFAKGAFDRKMTGLFQAHKDLDEQSMQQHMQRESSYKQQMGHLKVMQAERKMEGTSAGETRRNLTASNLMAETIMLGNMKKAQRALMYQREGIADERVAQELGFDMANANIQSQLSMPSWGMALMDAPDLAIGGMNTYWNFVKYSGRGGEN